MIALSLLSFYLYESLSRERDEKYNNDCIECAIISFCDNRLLNKDHLCFDCFVFLQG